MPEDKSRKARRLAEKAVDEAAAGDRAKAKRLAADARTLDPDAAQEVARETDAERRRAEKYEGKT